MKYLFLILIISSTAFAQNNKWSFIVMSDIHIYASGTVPSKFKKMVQYVVEKKPEIIFITGDHTSGNKGDIYTPAQIKKWYESLDSALTPIYQAGIKVIPTVGNHDFYEKKHKNAYIAWATKTLKKYEKDLSLSLDNPLYFNFTYKQQEFFIMKFWTYLFGKDQKSWFEKNTKQTPKYYRFAYGHVPLKSIRGRTTQSFYNSVLDSFLKGKVEIYFSGHEHMHWDEYLPGATDMLRQLTVGTTSGTYNHPIRPPTRAIHCQSESLCTMPATNRDFAIETRRSKEGYQVNSVNFVEVTFDNPASYSIKSYSLDSNLNLIDFYGI